MGRAVNLYPFIAFALCSAFAFTQKWSLPEFCWGTWLAALAYTWGCIVTAPLQIILSLQENKADYARRLPFLNRLPLGCLLCGVCIVSLSAGIIAFYIYTYLFSFYGLFLSVFSSMEPDELFGKNGFINSDFFTPVAYLAGHYWPIAAGVLLARSEDLFGKNPWKRLVMPFQKEIFRLHVMVLAMPFITLIAYALFRKTYQPITVVILMGLLWLLPQKRKKDEAKPENTPESSVLRTEFQILPALMIGIFAIAAGFYATYPAYLDTLDFTESRSVSSPSGGKHHSAARGESQTANRHAEIDEELRQTVRQENHVRMMKENDGEPAYSEAPDGIFGYIEPDDLNNPGRFVLKQKYEKDSHFEIHKIRGGGRILGFISEEANEKIKRSYSRSGSAEITLYNYRWSGAPVMFCLPLNQIKPGFSSRNAKTDKGDSVLALDITVR